MSDQPRRVQLRRTKGWRMPDNTVKVDRSTKWGNPYRAAQHSRAWAVDAYRLAVICVTRSKTCNLEHGVPTIDEVRSELAGKNLACWCPPDAPCHAEVLIEIANQFGDGGWGS